MKDSKGKGNSFEREIARELSLWWSKGKNKYVFSRSLSSGAWNTMHRTEGVTAHVGDMESVDHIGRHFTNKVMVETKWYKKEDSFLYEILLSKKIQILAWWDKCEKEATDTLKIPMLIVKFNYKVPFILFPHYLYNEIYKKYHEPNIKSSAIIRVDFDDTVYKHLVVMRLEDFLEWCKPEFFEEMEV